MLDSIPSSNIVLASLESSKGIADYNGMIYLYLSLKKIMHLSNFVIPSLLSDNISGNSEVY